MKKVFIFFLLFSIACTSKLQNGKSVSGSVFINKKLTAVYDSILQQHKDYKLILNEFEEGLSSQKENNGYAIEVLTVSDGKILAFATSDNKKVKETVQRLPDISPVEFLIQLRNIRGEIKIQRDLVAEGWIKRGHFPVLLELAETDVPFPLIKLLTGAPAGSDCLQKECLLKSSYAETHITTGYEAMHFMRVFLKVGGGYPSSLRNDLNLMKEWYYSGKPREDYKEMLDERMGTGN
ncbi:MAG TPA: hypothetical protein PLV06_11515 [Bacteroidales bacterium]|nr:hypothetical protein [Bacteroidales bacterium]HPR13004.1 hypothetical protein [Bacteroidales bacterium]HRW85339.1 hypothetical protein [Bacteroidales bacterium]